MRSPVCPAVALVLVALACASAKERSRLVTAQMRANALVNVAKHPWAKAQQVGAVAAAARWVRMSDDELWALVPSQELPRDIHTNTLAGCPACGDGIVPFGNYPWRCDFWNARWKVTCPNCRAVFPKNDFAAFYRTALDERGCFRRKLGDRSLLFNPEHPDPNDPLHKAYVDDGYGMVDAKGRRHRPVAYYCQWGHWRTLYRGLRALSRAYTVTSDRRYAHKAAVLLGRIADVYPEMDFLPLYKQGFEHSHGGSGLGRIEGRIWECAVGRTMASTYDHIFDGIQGDEALVMFCSRKAAEHKLGDKSSVAAICRHIEDHLLLEILESCKDGRIAGNLGMTHECLAAAAIALDRGAETAKWLDWLFDPRFPGDYNPHKSPIPWMLVEGLDRDGMGGECGGYGLIWTGRMIAMADLLSRYPAYTKHDLVRDYPKLKQCFLIESRLNCLGAVMPAIGDSGNTGSWGRAGRASTFARGFKLYGAPRLAALAWQYAGQDASRLRESIFEEDPMALARRIAETAGGRAALELRCEHLGRYGQAVLQTEHPARGRALWIHHGYGKGHSHHDGLNIGLYAKNVDMLPELGYPEYTGGWPKRFAWTANTISHNTLLVGDAPSAYSPGGKLHLFAVRPPLRVLDVSSKAAYQGLKTYRRTVALIDVSDDDSYVLDVFRARGGTHHRLSYHGPAEAATVAGIELAAQGKGTFAGPDVPFAKLDGGKGAFYRRSGFSYLYDVARTTQPVAGGFTADWKAEDKRGRIARGSEPHLRLHALTPCDEVALASGDPPQNKRGNPRRLRYLIQSRLGKEMASQFVTVLEPYDTTPFIRRVRRLKVEHAADPNAVAAVAVELASGATDVVVSCEEPTRVVVEGGVELDGQFAMVRLVAGQVTCMRMANARLLKAAGVELASDVAAYRGKVTRVDTSDPHDSRVFLDPPLPRDAGLVGQTIHFANAVPWDTTYDIKAIGDGWISTGDITIVAGFKDPKDFASGHKHLVNPGDGYVVPTCAGLDR